MGASIPLVEMAFFVPERVSDYLGKVFHDVLKVVWDDTSTTWTTSLELNSISRGAGWVGTMSMLSLFSLGNDAMNSQVGRWVDSRS